MNRVIKAVAKFDFEIENGETVHTTISVGIVSDSTGTEKINSLIKKADEALYTAKKEGKNQVQLYQNSEEK